MEFSKAMVKHIPESDREMLAEQVAEGDDIQIRFVRGTVKVSDADIDPVYYYRGRRIEQNEGVPTGYWGRWTVGSGRRGFTTDTLKSCKVYIDERIAWKVTTVTITRKPHAWTGVCRECKATSAIENTIGSDLSHNCAKCGNEFGVEWQERKS